MTKEHLFESLNSIDDDIILRSEKQAVRPRNAKRIFLKACAIAACLALFVTACISMYLVADIIRPLFKHNTPPISPAPPTTCAIAITPTIGTPLPTASAIREPGWNTYYAKVSSVSAMLKDVAGYFTEALSDNELASILPDSLTYPADYTAYSGYAGFDYTGSLTAVHLEVQTSLPGNNIHVQISDSATSDSFCYELEASKVRSLCGSVAFYLYIYENTDSISLYGDTERDGIYYHFTMNAAPNDLDAAKREFALVLKCFSNNGKGIKVPDLSIITPESIPEYKNEVISLNEAISDPSFGAYMLKKIPNGWQTESIRRYTDQNTDYLSGLWTHGYDSLSWRVSFPDSMAGTRITSASDTVNYDLSLYPIPRAESVPDNLREIVDNPIFRNDELTLEVVYRRAYKINDAGDSKDYRMHFSVLYGDILVEVSTKGISPEWLYEQLSGLTG